MPPRKTAIEKFTAAANARPPQYPKMREALSSIITSPEQLQAHHNELMPLLRGVAEQATQATIRTEFTNYGDLIAAMSPQEAEASVMPQPTETATAPMSAPKK